MSAVGDELRLDDAIRHAPPDGGSAGYQAVRVGVRDGPAHPARDRQGIRSRSQRSHVALGDVRYLAQQVVLERDRLQAEPEQAAVLDDELVLARPPCGGSSTRSISAPVSRETISARSIDPVDLGHLVEIRIARLLGRVSIASWMQRTVSWMWMNARVWPPVPWTVSG